LFVECTAAQANPAVRRSAARFGRGDILDTGDLSPGGFSLDECRFLNRKPPPFKTGVAEAVDEVDRALRRSVVVNAAPIERRSGSIHLTVARGSVVAYRGGSR
jgi:hypothetical protein